MPTKKLCPIGQCFVDWTVMGEEKRRGLWLWRCMCACGTEALVSPSNISRGASSRCRTCAYKLSGAAISATKRQGQKSLLNKNINHWLVLREDGRDKNGHLRLWAKCSLCANEKSVVEADIRFGWSKSCGCKTGVSARSRFLTAVGAKICVLCGQEKFLQKDHIFDDGNIMRLMLGRLGIRERDWNLTDVGILYAANNLQWLCVPCHKQKPQRLTPRITRAIVFRWLYHYSQAQLSPD